VVRENTDVPCAIGFGISTPEQAKHMGAIADGVIVGSAIIKQIAANKTEAAGPVGEYVKQMKAALA
jgi:tryptophan synthase alpha chain